MEITSGTDMEINWQWLLWQVGVPLGGPIAPFLPDRSVQKLLGGSLIGLGSLAQIFVAFLVVWRHNVAYTPNRNVYLCALGMLLLAVALGHNAYLKSRRN
jgi:hypothetical protein